MQTRAYKKKLTATTTEQTHTFEDRLAGFQVLNYGNNDVILEFENPIDADSIILPVRGNIPINADMLNMRYKTNNGTATIYIFGLKHEKS